MPLDTKVRWKPIKMAPLICPLVLLLISLVTLSNSSAPKCDKRPLGQQTPRTAGDNGFFVTVAGSPRLYRPGQEYVVSLAGMRSEEDDMQDKKVKFIDFMVVAESNLPSTEVSGLGTFRTNPNDAMARFSYKCSHAVMATSALPKEQVDVFWTAPAAGSGCIYLKAMVVERTDIWYMDDQGLTYKICEDDSPMAAPPIVEPCTACDEAKYEVIFEGLWSRHTHPKHFPKNEWETAFSHMIGASHSINYDLWKYGILASQALTMLAENGQTKELEKDMKRSSKDIRSVIKARGLQQRSNVIGRTFAVFRMDSTKHLLSLVSKIIPSPDWIVGVSMENLCMSNGSWVDARVIDLYPWDIGTNSGLSYQDRGPSTQPREAIHRITSCNPDNDTSPFFDPTCAPMKPVARLHILKQREYKKECGDVSLISHLHHSSYNGSPSAPSRNGSPVYSGQGIGPPEVDPTPEYDYVDYNTYRGDQRQRDQCEVTDWSVWTTCSQTCDQGSQSRSRAYKNAVGASIRNCQTKLFQKQPCKGLPGCEPKSYTWDPFYSKDELSQYSSPWSNTGLSIESLRTDNVGAQETNSYLYSSGLQPERQVGSPNMYEREDDPYSDPYDLYSGYSKQPGYPPRTNDPSSSRYNPYKEMGYYGYTYGGPPTGRYSTGVRGSQPVNDESDSSSSCEVNGWGDWSQCSSDCGSGTRTRTRHYVETDTSSCSAELLGQEPCEETSGCSTKVQVRGRSTTSPRPSRVRPPTRSRPLPSPRKLVGRRQRQKFAHGDRRCEVANWTQWSPCSVTCNNGYKMRTRVYTMPFVPNRICDTRLTEKQDCRLAPCFSDYYYDANDSPPLIESEEDEYNEVQEVVIKAKQAFCEEDPTPGIGRGRKEQWFFNSTEGRCHVFKYTGVGGNKNNFATEQECLEGCHPEVPSTNPNPFKGLSAQSLVREDWLMAEQAALDCQMSKWSDWSPCSASCGRGWRTRDRRIEIPSKQGGKACPKKMSKRKKCKALPCAASPAQWYQGSWRMMQE